MGVVGDTDTETISERADFAALGVGSFGERVVVAARLITDINARTAGPDRSDGANAESADDIVPEIRHMREERTNHVMRALDGTTR